MFRIAAIAWVLVLAAAECGAVQPYQPVHPDPVLEPWRWQFFDELNGQGLQCLAEDSSGNMWFGIDEGVVRYDGITWMTYRPEDGLHGAPVITLYADRDGGLYAGTAQGISRFKDGAWQRIFPPEGDMAWIIKGLTQTSDGSLWAATRRGPLQLKGKSFTLLHPEKTQQALADSAAYLQFVTIPETALPSEGDFPTFDVFQDRDGTMWFSCSGASPGRRGGEILRCDLQKVLANDPEAWRLYTEADGLDSGRGARIIQTRDSVIWTTANYALSGVNRFDGTAWSHIRLSDLGGTDFNPSILETRDGAVWISGFAETLHTFRDGRWHIRSLAALANTPFFQSHALPWHRPRLLEASDGALWMAGLGQGAVRVDLSRWQSYDGLLYQGETSDGARWFVIRGSSVVRSNGNAWVRYGVEDGLMDTPMSLMITRNNVVWAAGRHENIAATARFDGNRWQLKQHPRLASMLNPNITYETSDGSLWFSAVGVLVPGEQFGGLLKFDGQTWTHYVPPEAPGGTYGIAQTPDERLWFTGTSVSSFAGQTWTPVTEPRELTVPASQGAYVTREGDLWIGTRTYGIFRYNGQTWTRYDMQDGLAHGRVYAISQTADGSLWAGTAQGTSRFDGQTWTDMPHFGVLRSLHQSRDGALWMNLNRRMDDTRTGRWPLVIRYQPDTVAPETEITLFADEISQPGNTTLSWTGADPWRLTPHAKLQYAYRLDGGEWSPFSKKTSDVFLSLASGDHTFEVKARDRDFNEDPTPAMVQFTVVPPVWRQPWFIGLMAILLGGIGFQTVRVVRRDRTLQEANTALSAGNRELFQVNRELQESNQALQRERAVERIRGQVQAMEKASDFDKVLSVLAEDLKTVGLHFDTCGIDVLDEPVDEPMMAYFELHGFRYTTYKLDPEGTVTQQSYHIPAPFPDMNRGAIERFATGQVWQGRDMDLGAMAEVPISQYGRLRMTASDRQDFAEEDIDTLQDFAVAIALGYSRYLDFQQLEAQNRELEEANQQIQEQTNRKSRLLASMSHELRTPMTAIKGFVDNMLDGITGELNERQQRNLKRVTENSGHLLHLVNDLLDLSKIEANRMDVEVETFDVKGLIASCCDGVHPLVKPEVTLKQDVPDDVGEANTDGGRLRQIITNLLSNALKFTDSGEVVVRVSKDGRADDEASLIIAVSDTGTGIPADALESIFEEFQQVKGSDPQHKGTGLGLPITKGFAELLGGSIGVQSEVGKGSTFTVRVPVVYKEG